jgi:membrane protease YdiL (CAAX protease family)
MDGDRRVPNGAESATPPRRVWGLWATIGFGLTIGLVLLVAGAVAGSILGAVSLAFDPNLSPGDLPERLEQTQGLVVAVSTIISAIVSLVLVVVLIRARRGLTVREYLGLRKISWKTVLILLGVTVALLLSSAALDSLLRRPPNDFDIRIYETSVWPPALWAAVIVFAPAFEETLFRGFLFEGFRQSRLGGPLTVLIMALAWSSLHIQYDLYGMGTIFVLGLVLGAVRLKTGSLWSPLLMHGFWNFVATLQMGLGPGQ